MVREDQQDVYDRPDLKELSEVFDAYALASPARTSSFSFPAVMAWKDFFTFSHEVIEGTLCVFAHNEIGSFLYMPPMGKNPTRAVAEKCFAIMEEKNAGSGVTRIENVPYSYLSLFPADTYIFTAKPYEYVYYRDDLVQLVGNPYKSKRSAYNQFVSRYKYEYLPFEPSMFETCLRLYDTWSEYRQGSYDDPIYDDLLEENRMYHDAILAAFKDPRIIARVVKVDGKIQAYTAGFAIKPDVFCVGLEVAPAEITGLAVYIFRSFCDDAAVRPYRFINVMDDCGFAHLGLTKMSFRPSILESSFIVKKRDPRMIHVE